MTEQRPIGQPRPIEWLTRPLIRFLHVEAASGVVLVIATAFALSAANSPLAPSYEKLWNTVFSIGLADWKITYPLWYWVNDGLMTVFFFLVGLEIKREIVAGELREPRHVVTPVAAAIGGAVAPAVVYIAILHGQPGQHGWAIPMATDIAFVVGLLALLGKRVPHGLKVFVLTLAIVDDMIAVLIIAVFYSSQVSLEWLAAAAVGLAVVLGMNKLGVRTVVGYLLIGAVIWFCTLKSGVHPTISGVILGLLTPALPLISKDTLSEKLKRAIGVIERGSSEENGNSMRHVIEEMDFATRESISPLERFEADVHPWAAFVIMPVFALANAAVPFSASSLTSPIATTVALALLIGKPLGILFSMFVVIKMRLGIAPGGANWGAITGAGCLAGIGFTMSLFVASLSLESEALLASKTGILMGSALSAVLGFIILHSTLRREEH